MNRFFLGAYWGAREESIDECANRLLRFFADFTTCDPALKQWFKLGRSRKQALQHQVDTTNRDTLLKLLDRGRSWTDYDKRLMADLGFSVWLWNGGDDNTAAQLSVSCGAYSQHMPFPNNIVLRLPRELDRLSAADRMARVLAASVNAWEPNWAGVISDDAMDARKDVIGEPFVDWMVYLCSELLPEVPRLPAGATAQPIANGTLIVVQEKSPDPRNTTEVNHIQAVDSALRQHWRLPRA